jgi:hypothetical protein
MLYNKEEKTDVDEGDVNFMGKLQPTVAFIGSRIGFTF